MDAKADLALDLTALCDKVTTFGDSSDKLSLMALGDIFGYDSREARSLQIVSEINYRFKKLIDTISSLDLDQEQKVLANAAAHQIGQHFSIESLSSLTLGQLQGALDYQEVRVIKMISPVLRAQNFSYPKIDVFLIDQLLTDVELILTWLKTQQDNDWDVVRHALIDGLESFYFKIQYFDIFGWPGAVTELREVIVAYFALERAGIDPINHPLEAAIVSRTFSTLKSAFEKLKMAKDIVETGETMLKWYGAAMAIVQGGAVVSGLLTGPN